MKFEPQNPPRRFQVRPADAGTMVDCGDLRLDADEQISLVTASGRRWDVAAKDWGFYATPSINYRLKNEGLRAALAVNAAGRLPRGGRPGERLVACLAEGAVASSPRNVPPVAQGAGR